MVMKKKRRGGVRQGAGAKPKYNEPTKTISFRVPVSKITEIKKIIKNMLANFLIKK